MIFPKRAVIYVKDVMLITGKSRRSSNNMLTAIRKYFNKGSEALISIEEFCVFTGLPKDMVQSYILN